MRIERLLWDEPTEIHIWSRHRVTPEEVEEAAFRHCLALRGRGKGVYEVYGRTVAGRYLMIALRYRGRGDAIVITAREMSETERRRYRMRIAH